MPKLVEQTGEAIAFFNSERTPAALLTGAALSLLFTFPIKHGEPHILGLAKRMYVIMACGAVCNELVAVFSASLAIARLLGKVHDPMAESALGMIVREYPLYFCAVRAHFLTGLVCFTGALSIRMYTEYSSGCSRFARAMLLAMASTALFMVSLFNASLIYFDSFADMWYRYITLLMQEVHLANLGATAGLALLMAVFSAYEVISSMSSLVIMVAKGEGGSIQGAPKEKPN